ncbi:MAG TPA: hypothetical protein VJS40_09330 [Aestuariivirgaceae bacterium]|nr:hypothetical protein [Aestuariivirgaceae bacterium]
MHKLLIGALALGVLAGPALAAGLPEKAESRVYWKGNEFIMERESPLAAVPAEDYSDNFAGGFYSNKVTAQPLYVVPSTVNPSLHLKNR